MPAGDRDGRPARLRAQARFLGAWGHLGACGVADAPALAALAEETTDADLRELALAAARGVGPALDAHGGCLEAWLAPVVGGERRAAEHLVAAGDLLEREARGASARALLWARL
ncbi:MAG: hypothetical protein KF878_37695, partial [Planctomycetes bacterium]|nr:hypothetical protein [Planctomycetota bacterium]